MPFYGHFFKGSKYDIIVIRDDSMNEKIIIETDRLILRQYKLDDIDDVVEGLNNINVTKWL